MALRALMLKKDLDNKRKALAELLKKDAEFEARALRLLSRSFFSISALSAIS